RRRAVDASALAGPGLTHLAEGPNAQALADSTRGRASPPEDGRARGGRGWTYRVMGRYDEALADFNRAIELDPGDDDHIMKRAEIQRHIGSAEPTVLQTAPRFTPASRPVARQLADMCRRSADGSYGPGRPRTAQDGVRLRLMRDTVASLDVRHSCSCFGSRT